jgi:hypothetical protein
LAHQNGSSLGDDWRERLTALDARCDVGPRHLLVLTSTFASLRSAPLRSAPLRSTLIRPARAQKDPKEDEATQGDEELSSSAEGR